MNNQEMCRISVKLKPHAKREAINIDSQGLVTIAVTSPPVDGKANEQAVKILAKKLGIAKSDISIFKGVASRNKVFEVTGMDKDMFLKILSKSVLILTR